MHKIYNKQLFALFKLQLATLATRREWKPKCVPQWFLGSALGRTGQLWGKFFYLSQVTIPDIFAKGNSAQFPYLVSNGELPQGTEFYTHPGTRVKALSLERLSITFTSNGKREFVPRDQVSSLLVVYCSLFLHLN